MKKWTCHTEIKFDRILFCLAAVYIFFRDLAICQMSESVEPSQRFARRLLFVNKHIGGLHWAERIRIAQFNNTYYNWFESSRFGFDVACQFVHGDTELFLEIAPIRREITKLPVIVYLQYCPCNIFVESVWSMWFSLQNWVCKNHAF